MPKRELSPTEDKLLKAVEKLEGLNQKLEDKTADHKAATTEKKQAALQRQIEKLTSQIQKQEFNIQKLKIELKKEQIAQMEQEVQDDEDDLISAALGIADKKILQKIIDQAHTVINLKATRLIISRQEREAEEFLRRIIGAHPSGWTFNEDVNKRYKYVRIGRLTIVLQDSPSYSITFTELEEWIGLDEAKKFAKVDIIDFVKKVELGGVQDKADKVIALEDWIEKRTRSVGAPKVAIKEEDPVGRERVLVVNPELLGEPVSNLGNLTNLTGHEINPLVATGIEKVAQIRGFSGDQLMSIQGIGPTRAKKIIDEISLLSEEDSSEKS